MMRRARYYEMWQSDWRSVVEEGIVNGKGDYEENLKRLEDALAKDPENDLLLSAKGFALFTLGRFDEAVESLEQAIEINPSNENARAGKWICINDMEILGF